MFIDVSTSSRSELKMHPSERNGTSMVVRMDESSKSPTFDLEEHEEQAGGNFDAIQTPRGRLASK